MVVGVGGAVVGVLVVLGRLMRSGYAVLEVLVVGGCLDLISCEVCRQRLRLRVVTVVFVTHRILHIDRFCGKT